MTAMYLQEDEVSYVHADTLERAASKPVNVIS